MAKIKKNPLQLFQDRLAEIYTPVNYKLIIDGLKTQRQTALRINTLKINRDNFIDKCNNLGVILKSVPWSENAFILEKPDLRSFQETELYLEGLCYIQSLSSMIPPILLNPQKNEDVLDLCAAPGSKTTQMAALMGNTGQIVANDASHTRVYRLQANLDKLGVTNTKVMRSVGQGLWHEYPEYFDRVLVDVPCSMEGRINPEQEETYTDWSVKKIKELQEIQKFLLKSAISATKVGGIIVYSTCTLSPEENEGVIDWALRKSQGTIEVEDIEMPEIQFDNALKKWHDRVYDTQIIKTKRILPSALYEGFYIAKLRKIAPSI